MFLGYMLNYKREKRKTALGCWVGDADFVPAASGTWFWGRSAQIQPATPSPDQATYPLPQRKHKKFGSSHLSLFYCEKAKVKPIAEKGQSGEVEFQAAADGDYFFHVGRPGSVVTHISGMILGIFRRICRIGAGNRQACMNFWLTYTRLVARGCSKFFWKIKGNRGNRRAKVRYCICPMQLIPGGVNGSSMTCWAIVFRLVVWKHVVT